jgi:hypothetical protein
MNTLMQKPKYLLALTALAVAAAVPLARAQTAEEFRQMKSLMEDMKKTIDAQNARIAALEKTAAAAAERSPSMLTIVKISSGGGEGQQSPVANRGAMNDQQEAASRPKDYTLDTKYNGFIPVPNTPVLFKLNAKPHVDAIQDNRNAGNQNRFVPAVFPLEGDAAYGGGSQFRMNANATQLRADVRAPSLDGNLRFYYQNDFFGSGSDTGDMKYRIQHIYGQIYGFKAGFTYGVWEDPDSWPDTVDYEGPAGVIFSRRPVMQYTVSHDNNWNTTFGMEKADIYVDMNSGPNPGGHQLTRLPDFGLNTRYEQAGFGHLQFSGMLRELSGQDSKGKVDHVLGWGVNASAGIELGKSTSMQFLGVYGEGVGGMGNDTSFLNSDAAYNKAGELEALPYWSIMGALTQKWDEKWRSTFSYSYVQLDNASGQSGNFYHLSHYASANIVYQLRKRLSVGLEGLYGRQDTKNMRTSGDHYRFQLGMVYSLFD